ncbi:hypothetical protein N7481_013285 [Penicillium waksmanii]|uniref:uncharacterized protein n=1 Tax=Penicillium waksmanii TaxID=69791 RepID=UPI002546855C|nr:uncharacterized protein N7481_013285 [Penicillium waksmanii]KAJ5966571.1 hypothetical protein N7481_013285 [Penicillium waksmanii]
MSRITLDSPSNLTEDKKFNQVDSDAQCGHSSPHSTSHFMQFSTCYQLIGNSARHRRESDDDPSGAFFALDRRGLVSDEN